MCDTVVVISDEAVLFAKNSDRDANEAQALEWHAAADHAVGTRVAATHLEIPQVPHTHATVLSRPWWMFGAEMGANEFGVVIGNEAVYTTEKDEGPALLGMDLVRLGLERAASASAAVEVIVSLLERHGQGGACSRERPTLRYHNSFLVADRAEAHVIETAGRHVATERVTRGVRAISNGLTISGFAEQFAQPTKGRVNGCAVRRAFSESGAGTDPTVRGLMALMRDHGAEVPQWSPVHGSLRAPCVHAGGVVASSQTVASLVARLGDAPQLWATATSAPCTSVFKPVAVGDPVDVGPSPFDQFDPASLWWRHETLHRSMLRDYAQSVPTFARERDELERGWALDAPSSAEAFKIADELDERWRARWTPPLADRRPQYVAWRWAALDTAAGVTSSTL